MSRPGKRRVSRDTISYLFGMALVVHQALFVQPREFNLSLMLLGGALMGVPGVGAILAARGQGGGTTSPRPSSAGDRSALSPPSSSRGQASDSA